jgi:hypothetical protein
MACVSCFAHRVEKNGPTCTTACVHLFVFRFLRLLTSCNPERPILVGATPLLAPPRTTILVSLNTLHSPRTLPALAGAPFTQACAHSSLPQPFRPPCRAAACSAAAQAAAVVDLPQAAAQAYGSSTTHALVPRFCRVFAAFLPRFCRVFAAFLPRFWHCNAPGDANQPL